MMATSSPTSRVFFALWPDAATRASLQHWQPGLAALCNGRVMEGDSLHLTLLFLGEVATARLEALSLAAQEVAFEPFELQLDEVRYWGHNHIVYAAPSAVPVALQALVAQLETHMRQHRFAFEQRPYKPHVTLLRNASWTDMGLPAQAALIWRAEGFVLVRSTGASGPGRYEVVGHFSAAAGD